MDLGELEVELSELGFYPIKALESYDLKGLGLEFWLIKRAVYPKNIIVKDGSKQRRLSDFDDMILKTNSCIILRLEGNYDYTCLNKHINKGDDGTLYRYEINYDKRCLQIYNTLGEFEFLKKFNYMRYDRAKSWNENQISNLKHSNKEIRKLAEIQVGIGICTNFIERCENWFVANIGEIPKTDNEILEEWLFHYTEDFPYYRKKKEWKGKLIDLFYECIRRINRKDANDIDEAFNWAAENYIWKDKNIEIAKLKKILYEEKSKKHLFLKDERYKRWTKKMEVVELI